MDLYTIILTLDVPGQQNFIRLTYRDKERANDAYQHLIGVHVERGDILKAADDYGREVTIRTANIAAVQLNFVNSELDAEADLGVLQRHAQMKFERRLATDPMMKVVQPANGPLPFMPRGN